LPKEAKTTLSPNSQFGRYEIRSLLGVGGMGEVYLAYDSKLRRQVAIKLLPAELTQNKVRLARFEREAFAASGLNHPNIMTIYEIGEEAGTHFIASEFIEGESLRQRMSRSPLDLRETLAVTSQIADALSVAHEAGIVHRDIKPENVMVRRDGYVKVLDFGLAKLAHETATAAVDVNAEAPTKVAVKTEPGMVMGTANYMSPEQARGLEVDARSDIWSLAVVLYELAAGRLPFEGSTTTDVLAMILHREPPSLLLYQSSLPAELERIVEKALAKDRAARYQTAKDLSVDLKRLKQRLEVEAEMERSITPEEEARRTSAGAGTAGVSGIRTKAISTNEATVAPTVSSAEYVVGEIKRHKTAAIAVAAVILVAAAAFVYGYFARRSSAITSVAVLPFTNLSGDPNMEYLSDGLSESLINSLSQFPSLKVIARGSAFKYKGKEVDPQEVAKTLGVQAIVTGRVMQRGDQLQVSAELVNASDKTQLWGEQFNRKATDALIVQTEIAQQIATKLRSRLTNADQEHLVKEGTVSPEAYEQMLKGRFYQAKNSPDATRKSIEYFNQAIAVDQKYALAYALLGMSYRWLGGNGLMDPKEARPKVEATVRKALELDENLAEAHYALAALHQDDWNWAGAERENKRAIELNPNHSHARSRYAFLLSLLGRTEQAVEEARKSRELDPAAVRPHLSLGYILSFGRQYNQAVEHLKNALEMQENSVVGHHVLGLTYSAMGKYNDAIAEYKESLRLGGATGVECYLVYALAKAGQPDEAEKILKRLETTKDYVSPAELAIAYLGLGDKEQALSLLERAYATHDPQMQFLVVDPHYDAIRSEPRFKELIRKVGLSMIPV
jgi:serine/threonine protein kinase/Tfp pilus assembly protein PilF